MKRRAPPWGAIEAFIVASRASSFKDAAAQLALSPAAFSRRIQTLEDHVRVRLFDRAGSSPTLTVAGERYLQRLQPSFEAMRAATEWMAPDPDRRSLRVGLSQSFALSWLVPRLPRFYQQTKGIELLLQTCADGVDLIGGAVDVRILFGCGDWASFESRKLFDLSAFVVSAPKLLDGRAAPQQIESVPQYPLLELTHPADQWSGWLARQNLSPARREPVLFDSAMVMYEAAAQGLGLALGVSPLVDGFLASGRLRRPFENELAMPGAYYVAALPEFRRHEAVQIFWRWLLAEAAREKSNREGLKLVVSQ
ncbi:MAG: LysR family transcriptional regulator [Hydrocarboniphaga sp.]|uniref:LysR substrate-binding domain-containing protein n=1 Tax=Hydrocarboniphaga sp. TaxID=2033016 RepID=UPI0026324C4C|nr:LysR substrate-binding domain-containing protein [Hydrocarboniphaga sp.]MDB5968973.1 LysR family transcriptional regulator [Hydrocarboniphaga sp.]